MSSYKQLNKADVTTSPYTANKQWILPYDSSSLNGDSIISIYKGTYITGTFYAEDPSIDPVTNNQYERLLYDSINHLFYQEYTEDLNTGSLMFNVNTYESASSQRPTSSYFEYNANPLLIRQYPTGSGSGIRVLVINQDAYGAKPLPHSFRLSSSVYDIRDDGNGNLYDVAGAEDDYIDLLYLTLAFYFDDPTPNIGITFVGNIFYAQGIATITNPDYQTMFPLPPLALNNVATFYENDFFKIINILSNDIARTGTLNTGSVVLSGSNSPNYTVSSSGELVLNASGVGNYDVYYTVNNSFNNGNSSLTSNKAKVSVRILPLPTCSTYRLYSGKLGTAYVYKECVIGRVSPDITILVAAPPFGPQQNFIDVCVLNNSLRLRSGDGYWENLGECVPVDILCYSYDVGTFGNYDVTYTDCSGTVITFNLDSSKTTICAQEDSITFTYLGAPGPFPPGFPGGPGTTLSKGALC